MRQYVDIYQRPIVVVNPFENLTAGVQLQVQGQQCKPSEQAVPMAPYQEAIFQVDIGCERVEFGSDIAPASDLQQMSQVKVTQLISTHMSWTSNTSVSASNRFSLLTRTSADEDPNFGRNSSPNK